MIYQKSQQVYWISLSWMAGYNKCLLTGKRLKQNTLNLLYNNHDSPDNAINAEILRLYNRVDDQIHTFYCGSYPYIITYDITFQLYLVLVFPIVKRYTHISNRGSVKLGFFFLPVKKSRWCNCLSLVHLMSEI